MSKIVSVQHISQQIKDLLILHDCVIIPNFGAFVGNQLSASMHPVTHLILAPSKKLLFNKNITQDDGLLISKLMNNFGLLYQSLYSFHLFQNQLLTLKIENLHLRKLRNLYKWFLIHFLSYFYILYFY